MLTDGELSDLFTHDNARVMQSQQRIETKRMMVGSDQPTYRKRRKFYTALIFLSGSLICVSFGMMLGWPSPSYPILLSDNTPIPISVDQSAMIAGMLMNGFVVSTPFAGCECLGSKFGVLLGAAILLSGWLLMIGASDVLGLCISRILVGLGAGFGTGKFKTYIREICDERDGVMLQKILPLFVNFGIVLMFSIGPFVSFRMQSVVAAVVPGIAFLTFTVVPDTPYNLYKHHKVTSAVSALQYLHGKQCVDNEIENIKNFVENKPINKSIFQILRNPYTRKAFVILTFLMTIQQFVGGPSLIVYSQITYTKFNFLYPYACSIVYAIVFLVSTGLGIKYIPFLKRKLVLLLCLFGCMTTSAMHACYMYLNPVNLYYTVIPFVTMIAYCFCWSCLAVTTLLVVNDIFPTNARYTMTCYWNMYTAELAVIITKIFQVLFDRYEMYVPFCLYTAVSVFGFFVILIFMTETKGKLERNRTPDFDKLEKNGN